eukprot:CAMPEP_0195519762 /NCGR_PEP_ID=MMETSP0794_2-20130614/15425_1 /TAXON_ID=515487 /ORGANISM="Stephanopyxis turris, Strain CCMP 815" /LENGTH=490 /DNA_ID=CAMNT_0040648969 /DNA_START=243 /DNA_END=1715 /DNA_ORIENTATION=+
MASSMLLFSLLALEPLHGFRIAPQAIRQTSMAVTQSPGVSISLRGMQPSWWSSSLHMSATIEDVEEKSSFTQDDAVVCARGICVLADTDVSEELCYLEEDEDGNLAGMTCVTNEDKTETDVFSFEFLWPRALLLGCSCLYGTNFPLGRIMNDALPASATTSARMLLAFAALSPFMFKLKPALRKNAIIGGSFCAMAYLSQSIALIDTPSATVAFLGALTVIITPTTTAVLDKVPMGPRAAPQVWLAAILCLVGVGTLELGGGGGLGELGWGDFWAALQGVGFGIAFYFTEGMMSREPEQALPITSVQVGMTAFYAAVWASLDGLGFLGDVGGSQGAWLMDAATREHYALPGLFTSAFTGDEVSKTVALAAAWTALITTSGNRVCETIGLGKVSSSEAAVLLATEPLWAAVFASVLVKESMGLQDIAGGALIVAACLSSALKPETLLNFVGVEKKVEDDAQVSDITISAAAAGGESVSEVVSDSVVSSSKK